MAITNVVNANGTTPLPVGQGGTSTTSLTTFALLKGDAAGHVSSLTAGTNGQLPIGSTGSDPVMATLTAGTNITITNGAGSITIDATGGGGGITNLLADDTNTASGTTVTLTGDGQNIFTTANNADVFSVSFGPKLALPATNTTLTEGVITISGAVVAAFPSANVFIGGSSGNGTLTGNANVGIGPATLSAIDAGEQNIAAGLSALAAMDFGNANIAMGTNSMTTLNSNTAVYNVGIGFGALSSLATGAANLALGLNAGGALIGTESSNILIMNNGVAADNNTIRIGTEGNTQGLQNLCFIAGIANATVTGSPVLVDTSTGQLGLAVSSLRFKQNVIDMGDTSSAAMKLRPVTFSYKQDVTNAMQYGLIAEEVADVMPHLVTYDAYGQPYTVRYQDLPSILLNELQKLSKRVEDLEAQLAEKE
jgi:hypothetical protein